LIEGAKADEECSGVRFKVLEGKIYETLFDSIETWQKFPKRPTKLSAKERKASLIIFQSALFARIPLNHPQSPMNHHCCHFSWTIKEALKTNLNSGRSENEPV
jgi:hypothetical protein